ncbi:MmgE/PrpD family protein [Bordetella parapertussis]|uniref:MmgE/PrpD family protein n=5 Tax=Pseudomonadota TaxID=1224 RepID=Q7W581_BORPA|nr:MmgE/PrpD family protein [Bordetella parapertussis]AOB40371.1 hypothetical protein BBB43_17230 [Bordetella parapertussis]AUL44395.1 hypothetical protein BTL54_17330 [Bordetella parapertussis]AWP64300.1 hypothetical protein B7P06_17345 [Bordetella parapertussis]AWP71805.1 hypothetical protein B7O99_17335 [Bordetella parapertussis]AWP90407.1 hypothetical protein B7P05_17335 [Bordetella parapertussis]
MQLASPSPAVGVTRPLADAIVATASSRLGAATLQTAQACLLDSLAVTLAGAQEPLVAVLDRTLAGFGGAGQATLIGRGRRAPLPDAALVNGAAGHALDFDDMHIESAMHPSVPVVAAALAVAEHEGADGAALLRALALGIEAQLRIGEAVRPHHYQRGWHATGTLGHFGAAVAAGCLLGLDAQQTTMALGIAGTQASGLKETFGTMSKPLHAGQVARNGVMAALLARQGYTSAEDILGGHYGFGRVCGDGAHWDGLLDGWGERWSMHDILYKPHASSFCTQALIECALALRATPGFAWTAVARIHGEVSAMSMANARIVEPRDGMQAKFSLPHAIAQGLVHGQATIADFSDARAREPALRALRARTTIAQGAGLAWPEAIVTVTLADGSQLRRHADLRASTATSQDKWRVTLGKFMSVAGAVPGFASCDAVRDAVLRLPEAPGAVAALMALLRPQAATPSGA